MGDVCRSVPVLVSLRHAFPDAQIDWIVQDAFAPVIAAHPDLSKVIPFPRDEFARAATSPKALRALIHWLNNLRRNQYDLVYDFQGLARSGFFTWYTRAPKRVGFRTAREAGYLGYTHRYRIDPTTTHTVDRMLALLAADDINPVPDLRLYVSPADQDAWQALRPSLALPNNTPYVILAPTSRWPGKQWPAERFAQLVPALIERGFKKILIVGSQSERSQCTALLSNSNNSLSKEQQNHLIDAVGKTSIGTLMAAIQTAALVIANDSAPLHMAVGLKRRYLALFGPTNVAKVGPYQGERWVLQNVAPDEPYQHKNATTGAAIMNRITPQQVIGKLDELLLENPLTCPHELQE